MRIPHDGGGRHPVTRQQQVADLGYLTGYGVPGGREVPFRQGGYRRLHGTNCAAR